MKKILGLDVGTNSIGGALVTIDEFGKRGKIDWMGSRIIPLDGDSLLKFENGGQAETKAAARRLLRGSRRLKQRYKLRRSRLVTVLKLLKWIPAEFPENFEKHISEIPFNINNYIPISENTKAAAYAAFGTDKISEDWIVYYLRAKALKEEITLPELARIIYMLNQRRGFKSSRKDIVIHEEHEEEKFPKFEKWVEFVTILSINEEEKDKDKTVYRIKTDKYEALKSFRNKPDWEGKTIELEITRKTTKAGEISYSFSLPNPTEWEKQKTALNNDVAEWIQKDLCGTIGEYFFLQLKDDKNYRIRQRIVERKLYKQELELIWKVQSGFHKELSDNSVLNEIATALYKINKAKQKEITSNDLFNVIANDIIYYQRPLKSQKDSIDECTLEKKKYIKDGIEYIVGIKVAPKSSPEFQEFRIWQDIHNIRVFEKEGVLDNKQQINIDITESFITNDIKASLFELFNSSGEITENAILKKIDAQLSPKTHKINLFANREKLKGNETKAVFRKVFKKHHFEEGNDLLENSELFYKMWHALYSLNEEEHIYSAFKNLKDSAKNKINIPELVVAHLSKLPELSAQYAAYSSKAIKKLLPLMRCGKYWNPDDINNQTKERIEKIVNGEYDEDIDDRSRQLIQSFSEKNDNPVSGMPLWLSTYAVYGKHSERTNDEKYTTASQIDVSKLIPHNSLRNPYVEQVIREALNLVKDVFETYGQPDEIHIELARELKKTAEEKEKIAKANQNSNTEKDRIKKLLRELKKGNPESLSDLDKFKVWKNIGGYESEQKFDELFNKKNDFINQSDIEKYRIWADQNCLSPYTGKAIPLSLLFTPAYEIEHIFPRSRFFDDSFANKIICEAGVNKEKDKTIARLFIQQYSGTTFNKDGKTFTVFTEENYISHCKSIFRGKKLRNLLAESIPEDFVSRQLNDTRYISKKLADLLYPITKDKEGIIFAGGSITNELKNKWGLNKVWKEILLPRFERLEKVTNQSLIIPDASDANKFHFSKEYKRVDHRHHALDALIIAVTTRDHIRYLNTLNASDNEEWKNLKYRLVKSKTRDFVLPWPEFTKDTREALEEIIVSHKAINRIVSKPYNQYLKWVEKNGEYVKDFVKQEPPVKLGKTWVSVRRSMFKEPQGVIYLKKIELVRINEAVAIQIKKETVENKKGQQPLDYIYDQELRPKIKEIIKQFNSDIESIKKHIKKNPLCGNDKKPIEKIAVARFKEYASKRVTLDSSFDDKKINKIPYADKSPLVDLLKEHLKLNGDKPEIAFQGEGLMDLAKKAGKPIKKVTIHEAKDPTDKFQGRYYETDKGGNVFFVIKIDKDRNRFEMSTLPLLEAIGRLANKLPLVDHVPDESSIILSPNELVYVMEEGETINLIDWHDKKKLFTRTYKMVSCTGGECYFIPHYISKLILPYDAKTKTGELGSLNKSENTLEGISIKRNCIKIKLDRLGNVIEANGRKIVPQIKNLYAQ
ncbi:MAG TPA: HNH endonuclease domain-containing protein [Bacteroidia bacterium]|jgi:CRISPR-associated endonuclease Csn1|nr:HNH endonuclease domain-containing protein [Bacteroidia bacterium]